MFLSDLIYLSYTNKLKRKCFIKIITKVTLYAIWKDVTPPVIGTLTFSPTGWTNQNVTLTGKATDLGSGISYYQFSTNENLTSSSSGWISITNTTKEVTQTYSVSSNDTYYFYVKDAAGNVTKKSVIINKIDKVMPAIKVESNEGTYIAESGSTTANIPIQITANDTGGSGLDVLQYQLTPSSNSPSDNDENWKVFQNTIRIEETIPEGIYYLHIRVIDGAGNKTTNTETYKYIVKYQIQYDVNGGSGELNSQIKEIGSNVILNTTEPTKEGYVFTGWSDKKEETGEILYNPGDTYSEKKSITLYAHWLQIPNVVYSTHIQDIGWQEEKKNGEISGTTGQNKNIECIKVHTEYTYDDWIPDIRIEYEVLASNGRYYPSGGTQVGSGIVAIDGEEAGTTGRNIPLTEMWIAIKDISTGKDSKYFDIWYRGHVSDIGWKNWTNNGKPLGNFERSHYIQAFQIVITKKGENPTIN